jgi:polyphenol oxidase
VRWTARRHGDGRRQREGPARGWDGVADRPVLWLNQVHGDRVVVVGQGSSRAVEEGDALVTARSDVALGVLTADCASVALACPEGVVGAAHAGWVGLGLGILERTVEAMRALGASRVSAGLGPCIHAECYEFGPAELGAMTRRFGEPVRGTTAWGAPALDLPVAVGVALDRVGVDLVHDEAECTACARDAEPGDPEGGQNHASYRYFSHRARGEAERQAMVTWGE